MGTEPQKGIARRKREHLEICVKQDVEFRQRTTWFEHASLVHQAVPAFSRAETDLGVTFLGKRLAAPFIIGAMTGGTPEATEINRALAKVAAEKGIGLALGSQRAMMSNDALTETYRVRDAAPEILLLGNIGLSQAMACKPEEVVSLMTRIGADGMCLHLNPAMEMFQAEGDDPRGGAKAAIRRLARALGDRLIVKETGCGISCETAAMLAQLGVKTVDVAGAGGASWVRVENLRRGGAPPGLHSFEEWGIPTAASLLEARGLRLRLIASGGLRDGVQLATAIALGATLGSAALPILRAHSQAGAEGVRRWVDDLIGGLRAAMALTGCRDLKALRRAPVALGGPLLAWAQQRGLWRKSGA